MEVSGQLHAPAALPPGKEPPVPIGLLRKMRTMKLNKIGTWKEMKENSQSKKELANYPAHTGAYISGRCSTLLE
jgi:hypothetical protein